LALVANWRAVVDAVDTSQVERCWDRLGSKKGADPRHLRDPSFVFSLREESSKRESSVMLEFEKRPVASMNNSFTVDAVMGYCSFNL
jgi:hypothetical protein